MNEPNFKRAKFYVFERLGAELPDDLPYHGIHHTRDDVLPAAERLAALAELRDEDELLLRTAVLYHDVGYIERYDQNEPVGARVAAQTLPDFGYSPAQIAVIRGIILATRMPQAPRTMLQSLMCDADLDSLGRDDYLEISHRLRDELALHGLAMPLTAWYKRQHTFLSQHTFFTEAARMLRRTKKLENIVLLERLLGDMGEVSS
jgi:uncharacterized protein